MAGRGARAGGGHPDEATPAQRRYLRRLLGRYVRRVGGPDAALGAAFDAPLQAVAYALARRMLAHREEMEALTATKREAHDWISTLEQPEDAAQGVLGVLVLARRREKRYSAWRAAALSPLKERYGYEPGDRGWLNRLNAAIAERHGAIEGERERQGLLTHAADFRFAVVDPCFRPPGEDDGDGTGDGGAP